MTEQEKECQKMLYFGILIVILLHNLPEFFRENRLTRPSDNGKIATKFDGEFFRRVSYSTIFFCLFRQNTFLNKNKNLQTM